MSTRLSSAVMSHPRRVEAARRLAVECGVHRVVTDPEPDAPPSPARTAVRAWGAVDPGATHHLVVQDDIEASPDLVETVARCAERHPRAALAFYANWNSRNGALVRRAALTKGVGWVPAAPLEYTPTLALCLPAGLAREFVSLAPDVVSSPEDDAMMSTFLRERGVETLLAVPNQVEHVGDESIAGNDEHGIRRAACFVTGEAASARLLQGTCLDLPGWLPSMYEGEGFVLAGAAAPLGVAVPWQEWLGGAERHHGAVARILAGALPRDLVRAVAAQMGDAYAREVWVHSVLLGRQIAEADGAGLASMEDDPVAERALRTLAPGTARVAPGTPIGEEAVRAVALLASDGLRHGASNGAGAHAP